MLLIHLKSALDDEEFGLTEFDTAIDTKPKATEKTVEKPILKNSEVHIETKATSVDNKSEQHSPAPSSGANTVINAGVAKTASLPAKTQEKVITDNASVPSASGKTTSKVEDRAAAKTAPAVAQPASQPAVSESAGSSQEGASAKVSAATGVTASNLDAKRAQRAERFGIPVVAATASKNNGTLRYLGTICA